MRKMLVLAAAISITAFGCGGGGGGGSGGVDRVAVDYDGLTTQVALDSDNMGMLAERAIGDGNPLDSGAGEFMPFKAPAGSGKALARLPGKAKTAFRGVRPMESGSEDGSCGGSYTYKYTSSYMKESYDQYCDEYMTDGQIWDGYIEASGGEDTSGNNYTGKAKMGVDLTITGYPQYKMSSEMVELLVMRGNINLEESGTFEEITEGEDSWNEYYPEEMSVAFNMFIGVNENEFSLWYKDYTMFATYNMDGWEDEITIDGRVYYSDLGYIDIDTTVAIDADGGQAGTVYIEGDDGTGVKLVQTPDYVWTAYLESGDDSDYNDAVYYMYE